MFAVLVSTMLNLHGIMLAFKKLLESYFLLASLIIFTSKGVHCISDLKGKI